MPCELPLNSSGRLQGGPGWLRPSSEAGAVMGTTEGALGRSAALSPLGAGADRREGETEGEAVPVPSDGPARETLARPGAVRGRQLHELARRHHDSEVREAGGVEPGLAEGARCAVQGEVWDNLGSLGTSSGSCDFKKSRTSVAYCLSQDQSSESQSRHL